MKKSTIKSMALGAMSLLLTATGFAQNAQTFYVCPSTGFTLRPQTTTFSGYEWTEVGSSAPAVTTQDYTTTSPALATATTYETKQYTLRVQDAAGCWSDPQTFTVHILPAIPVTIAGPSGTFCQNSSTNATITATVGTLTLPTGVAANQYQWTANGSNVGTNSSTYSHTTGSTAGATNINVVVSYSLPATIGGEKLSTCTGTAATAVTITVNTPPTTPGISIQ